MKNFVNTIKLGIYHFLELLFPSKCVGCNISGQILCIKCIEKIRPAERPTEDNIIALYDYRDPIIKNAIWELKYHRVPYIGQKLGKLLHNELQEEIIGLRQFSLGSPILVIPVPISHGRKKKRGYNQSEVLAKYFCKCDKENTFKLKNNIIFKKANTIAQAKITNRTKRLKNLKDAFRIKNPEIVKSKTIIVIDDVTTTGATMTEIIKLLKKSGAKKVVGFAVAH